MSRMNRVLIFLSFLLFSGHTISQTWSRSYGPISTALNVIETYDKGYIFFGRFYNEQFCKIFKTDINGYVLWKKQIGRGYDSFIGTNIDQTTDDGYIIGGTTFKYNNQSEAFVIKLNACGELQWCNTILNPYDPSDLGGPVKATPDGGCILYRFDQHWETQRNNLYKFDINGNLVWHQRYYPDTLIWDEQAYDLVVDTSGILMTGYCQYGTTSAGGRFYNVKTDPDGNQLWSNVYGKSFNYQGWASSALLSNTGNYYSIGGHYINNSPYIFHPCFVKILRNGLDSYNSDLMITHGGANPAAWLSPNTMIIGCSWAKSTNLIGNTLIKTDTNNESFQRMDLPDSASSICSMTRTFDNKIVVIGTDITPNNQIVIRAYKVNSNLQYDSVYNHPYVYDSLCRHPIVNDTIDPNCGIIVNVEEAFKNPETHELGVYPNPAVDEITVIMPKMLMQDYFSKGFHSTTIRYQWNFTTLTVYNLKGEVQFYREIPKEVKELKIDVSNWQSGIYYLRLAYKDQTVAGKKLIVR